MKKTKRLFLSIPLIVALLLGSIVPVSAAYSGYVVSSSPFINSYTGVVGPLKFTNVPSEDLAPILSFCREFETDMKNGLKYHHVSVTTFAGSPHITIRRFPTDLKKSDFFVKYSPSWGNVVFSNRYLNYSSISFNCQTGEVLPSINTGFFDKDNHCMVEIGASFLFSLGFTVSELNVSDKMLWKPLVMGITPTFTFDYPLSSHSLSINYQYADGTQAAPPHTETIEENASYSVVSPVLDGYTADKLTISGTMGTTDIAETVVYSRIPQSHTLTVNYRKEDGSQVAETHTETVMEGDAYHVVSPALEGYNPSKQTVSGTMGNADILETVVYSKNPPPVVDHSLTINYIYADGSQAIESYMALFAEGEKYRVESPSLEGFRTDRTVVAGTMGADNLIITVVYTAYVPIVHYTLTIHYQYEDGTKAASDYSKTYVEGESYRISSPVLEGFQTDSLVISGTMGSEDCEKTVLYKPSASSGTPALTVHYLYSNGTAAAPDYNQTLTYGERYWIPSPTISGYIPSRKILFGSMGKESQVITVTYSPGSSSSGGISVNPSPGGSIPWNPSTGGGLQWNPSTGGSLPWNPSPGGGLQWEPSSGSGIIVRPFS